MLVRDKHRRGDVPLPVFGLKTNAAGQAYLLADGFLKYCDGGDYEVVDPRPSRFWVAGPAGSGELAFPEWFEPYFYENLDNDAPRETRLVESYDEFFRREYAAADGVALKIFDGGFGECPACGEVYACDSFFGVVKCPRCFGRFNNPCADHDRLNDSPEVLARRTAMREFSGQLFCSMTKAYRRNPAEPGLRSEIWRLISWWRKLLVRFAWRNRIHFSAEGFAVERRRGVWGASGETMRWDEIALITGFQFEQFVGHTVVLNVGAADGRILVLDENMEHFRLFRKQLETRIFIDPAEYCKLELDFSGETHQLFLSGGEG